MTITGCAALLGLLALPASAAQIEVGGGVSLPPTTSAETYGSRYEPPFRSVTHSGTASQQLTLQAGRPVGVWGTVTWLGRRRAGFELGGAFSRESLSGANGPYTIAMTYETRQPPDNVLRAYRLEHSIDWLPTEGHLDRLTVSGAVVGIAGRPDRVALRLSAGVALTSTSGRFGPLGFTTFQLGGHAVVFSDDYTLRMQVHRAWTAGFQGGSEVSFALSDRMTATAGVRVWFGPATNAPVSVAAVSLDTAVQTLSPADVDDALSAPPLRWHPAPFTFVAGLRVRL